MKKIIMLLAATLLLASCTPAKTVTVYFSTMTETDFYLNPVKRTVKGDDIYKLALEQLIKGPENSSEGNPVLPKTTKVLSVEKQGELLIVNFSKEIILDATLVGASSSTEALALASIANTLTEFPEVKRVKILVEGKDSGDIDGRRIEDFWGHIGIFSEFTRNEALIKP